MTRSLPSSGYVVWKCENIVGKPPAVAPEMAEARKSLFVSQDSLESTAMPAVI